MSYMKRIKVAVAKSAGFCFGVRRAINITLDASKKDNNVFMLGDIVHNKDVVDDIKAAGVMKISRLLRGKDKTLIIRAHGASAITHQKAKRSGYGIIDATCPMVKEIHNIAKRAEEKGYFVIVIGDKKHDEVRGIVGQLKKKALVIDSVRNIPFKKIRNIKRGCVVSQSTQNSENVEKIVAILKKNIQDLKFFNTICRPTQIKQEEIKRMPLVNDIMLIIGSKASANTKRLYEISRSINRRSYWIQSAKDIKTEWLSNAKSIGITSGASTPDYTTKEVIESVKKTGGERRI